MKYILYLCLASSLYARSESLSGDEFIHRAMRPDSPLPTSPISVVVPSLDLGAITHVLATINCKIGNVDQNVCQDTILGILGDACNILGISISEALELLLECCASTSSVDLNGVFTAIQDVKNTVTECCTDILIDLNGVFTAIQDVKNTVTECCTDILIDLNGVFTAIQDVKNTVTECCTDILDTVTNCGVPTHITQVMIPYTITQPGLYCLAENVTVGGGGTGITISSSNVILDLNFHSISNGTTGISTSSNTFSNITIENGYLLNQSTQAILLNSSVNLIRNCLTSSLNGTGIVAANVLMQNTIIDNCFIGNDTGISFPGTLNQHLTVRNTRIFAGTGVGANIAADDVIFENCAVFSAVSNGLSFTSNASQVYVKGCQFISIALSGVISASPGTVIEDCYMAADGTGVFLNVGANKAVIKGCSCVNGSGIGILVESQNVVIKECELVGNSSHGVFILGGTDTQIINCSAAGNGGDGFRIDATSTISQVISNVASHNTGVGFNLLGNATNKFYKNFATSNAGGNYSGAVTLVFTPATVLAGTFGELIGNTND